jgi:His-Xaa-Ser repeat protein HxsA
VIFGLYPAFYPWGYGYGYPYGYSYYDDGYYANDYAASEYSQSEYDNGNLDSSVSQVQAALAREGYYHGAIDGSVGPATRNALRRYQQNHGLDVNGRIDRRVLEALGLG